MQKKIFLAIVWCLGWVHVLGFAPDDDRSMMDFIMAVMAMDRSIVDPMVFMVFNMLGIWPLVMLAMLVQDDQGRLKAWPFALSAMVLGNSILYIYLFLRREQRSFVAAKTSMVRCAESKILALILLISTLALLGYGLLQGSLSEYYASWQVNYLVNVMTVDFFLFAIAFAVILPDDMQRRNMPINGWFWCYTLLPVLGATIYLLIRKPLPDAGQTENIVSTI